MRLIALLAARVMTAVAIAWVGLGRESAGAAATLSTRRRFAVAVVLVPVGLAVIDIARGTFQSRLRVPLWPALGIEAIVGAIGASFAILGLRFGMAILAQAKPPLPR